MIKSICVFCASGQQFIAPFGKEMKALVTHCKQTNLSVVYGGAKVGLMGLLADECIAQQVKITGVIPQAIFHKELQHEGIDDLSITHTMYERKQKMYELSDAFIVFPGSLGTLDELFEVLCLSKLHLHNKPIAILNIAHFYDTILLHFNQQIAAGFMDKDVFDYLIVAEDLPTLFQAVHQWQRPLLSDLDKASELNK